MNQRPFLIFPVLASVYPVLALTSGNPGERVMPGDMVLPATLSLVACLAVLLLAAMITRDQCKRAIIALVGIVAFNAYGRIWMAIDNASDARLLPAVLVVVAIASLLIRRTRKSLMPACRYLNVFCSILFLLPIPGILQRFLVPPAKISTPSLPTGPLHLSGKKPDVYIIILDKYTGSHSLMANYDYDDSAFLHRLESKGFFVPHFSHSNYPHTFLALASLLNWRYLADLGRYPGPKSTDWSLAYPLVETNATVSFFKSLGYRYYFFPSAFGATARSPIADVLLPPPDRVQPEFYFAWRSTTILEAVVRMGELEFPYMPEPVELTDWKFDQLGRLADSSGPKLVFAHLTVPHEPYVYRSDCTHRPLYWPRQDDGFDSVAVKRAYIEQLTCVNVKVGRLVEQLQRRSREPPVILLLADHGHGRMGRSLPTLDAAPSDKVRERLDIFSAYYFPGAQSSMYDSISPVNGMRTMLRQTFGLDLPNLDDASFWSSTKYPYDFKRVR